MKLNYRLIPTTEWNLEGGVENNKDRPSECSIHLINVNECEQESACWCVYIYLIIDY